MQDSVASLPDVESVLLKARGKAEDFAAQARTMQARVEEEQSRSRASLKAAKEEYERKLGKQAGENMQMEKGNTDLHSDIRRLKRENKQILEEAEAVSAANDAMRKALISMQNKVQAAQDFVKDSLAKTDDSNAEELTILEPTTPKPTLDHFLRVAQAASDVSFLQLSAHPQDHATGSPARAKDLVQLLASGLADISAAEKEGAAQLKASYLENYATGEKHKEALLTVRKSLMEKEEMANNTQKELIVARDHIRETYMQLEKRLHGLRIFARKVDTMAASALKGDVSNQTESPAAAVDLHSTETSQNAQMSRFTWTNRTSTTTTSQTTLLTTTPPTQPQKISTTEREQSASSAAPKRAQAKQAAPSKKVFADEYKAKVAKEAPRKHMDSKQLTKTKPSMDAKQKMDAQKADAIKGKSAPKDLPAGSKSKAQPSGPAGKEALKRVAESKSKPQDTAQKHDAKGVALVQSGTTAGDAKSESAGWPVFNFLSWR